MLSTEPSSDEHPDTECKCKWHVILTAHHDSNKTPDKPKYTHSSCESLRHKGGKLYNKSIVKIIPYARACDEEIAEDIETKESGIVEILSSL